MCQSSLVTANWWNRCQNNRKWLRITAVCTCCKTSSSICPRSGWQHSCQSLHACKQPCRNTNTQTDSVFCPPVPALKYLQGACVCSDSHLRPEMSTQMWSQFSNSCMSVGTIYTVPTSWWRTRTYLGVWGRLRSCTERSKSDFFC